jgi:4-amino-4-deoxychorismate lyase
MSVLVNGEPGGRVDPLDRGLLYGDGLFETIAVVNGRPRFLDWHLERCARGAQRLGFPASDFDLLRAEIGSVAASPQAVVKLVLTRGAGARGYRPPQAPLPTRIVAAFEWPVRPPGWGAGLRVGWCRTRLGRNPALAGLKHLNRLEQVLARAEWDDGAMDEGLQRDDRGHVIAATQANLFVKIGGLWVTPRLDQCGVAGVMRRAFCQWSAERGQHVAERDLSVADLETAQALLLTSSLIGARPVRELAGRPLAVDPVAAEFGAWLAAQ